MIKKLFNVVLISLLTSCISFGTVQAYQGYGWDQIRPDLFADGRGQEYVKEIPAWTGNRWVFTGSSELEAIKAAANFVAYHMRYESDPKPPGDVWTSSDQQFSEITIGVKESGTGDCEDFSILLCALLRFHTYGGISADRVWVEGGRYVGLTGEKPPVAAHAWVAYKTPRGMYYIEPQWGETQYAVFRGSYPTVYHLFYKTPPVAGLGGMLRFNDQWVKGGGYWIN